MVELNIVFKYANSKDLAVDGENGISVSMTIVIQQFFSGLYLWTI